MTLAALGAAAAVYGLFWNFMAGQFRAGIEQWAAERRGEGYQVGFSSLRVGGFPFRLEALVSDPVFSGSASGSGGVRSWTWRGPLLSLRARPWTPDRARVSAPGRHRVRVEGGARPLDLAVNAGTLNLSLRFMNGQVAHAAVSARDLMVNEVAVKDGASGDGTIRDGGGARSLRRVLSLVRAEIIVDRPARPASGEAAPNLGLDISFEANAIAYPVAPVPGLGRKTARMALKARVTGGLALKFDAETMAMWRDLGGTLEVLKLAIDHGPLGLDGDGTGALDGALQPIGAFSLRIRGFMEALDRLEDAGLIKPRPAALTKSVLGVLARSQGAGDGAGAEIKVSLSVQDGKFFIGPVAVAKMPVVRWPSGG